MIVPARTHVDQKGFAERWVLMCMKHGVPRYVLLHFGDQRTWHFQFWNVISSLVRSWKLNAEFRISSRQRPLL